MQGNTEQQRHAMIVLMSYVVMSMTGVIVSVHLNHTAEGHSFDKGVNPQGDHNTE